MAKHLFIAAFLVDDETYPDPDKHDVVTDLAVAMGDHAFSDFIVWSSAEDFVTDHQERGPINAAYLTDEDVTQ